MSTCRKCGKETGLLFQDDGLCWLCRSKQNIKGSSGSSEQAEDKDYEERRAWKRYPVHIFLKIHHQTGEDADAVSPGVSVNLSMGGICIEWDPCPECAGYTPGSIHDNCIYARYDNNRENSEILSVAIYLCEDDILYAKVKAVFTIKKNAKEMIGFSFCSNEQAVMERIQEIINAVE